MTNQLFAISSADMHPLLGVNLRQQDRSGSNQSSGRPEKDFNYQAINIPLISAPGRSRKFCDVSVTFALPLKVHIHRKAWHDGGTANGKGSFSCHVLIMRLQGIR
jgi:hypothetical protein